MVRLPLQLVFSLLLAGLAAGGWFYWTVSGGPQAQAGDAAGGGRERRPVLVEAAPARYGTVSETVEVVGNTRARNAIDVVASSSGLVTGLAFEAGQQMGAGDLLVEIDASSEQAAVLEAESELDNLRRQYERARVLLTRRLSSSAEVDDLAAQVRIAEARLAAARSRLDKRIIRAPFAGVVGLRNVSVGDYVDTSTVLTTLDDLSAVELDFELPEKFFGVIARGQPVSASSVAFPARRFAGSVRDIDTRINTATRSFRVRAELPNPEALLPEGLFMTATLTLVKRERTVLIPQEALIADGDQRYVFVVRDGSARRVAVQIGLRTDDAVEAVSGLAAGALVVTKGHQKLRDNAPVRLAASPTSAPAPAPAAAVPARSS